eukprot:TRINITY_DN3773_c0_g1_i2.p1 TRINITY_DN3773_c0_g1~~TRINITY_DN3773_c0_g1_i2.p1  ORF type:complete len:1004 (-),score=212.51 TRINITY_DN3773_c0_g1_i2:97-3030(-)
MESIQPPYSFQPSDFGLFGQPSPYQQNTLADSGHHGSAGGPVHMGTLQDGMRQMIPQYHTPQSDPGNDSLMSLIFDEVPSGGYISAGDHSTYEPDKHKIDDTFGGMYPHMYMPSPPPKDVAPRRLDEFVEQTQSLSSNQYVYQNSAYQHAVPTQDPSSSSTYHATYPGHHGLPKETYAQYDHHSNNTHNPNRAPNQLSYVSQYGTPVVLQPPPSAQSSAPPPFTTTTATAASLAASAAATSTATTNAMPRRSIPLNPPPLHRNSASGAYGPPPVAAGAPRKEDTPTWSGMMVTGIAPQEPPPNIVTTTIVLPDFTSIFCENASKDPEAVSSSLLSTISVLPKVWKEAMHDALDSLAHEVSSNTITANATPGLLLTPFASGILPTHQVPNPPAEPIDPASRMIVKGHHYNVARMMMLPRADMTLPDTTSVTINTTLPPDPEPEASSRSRQSVDLESGRKRRGSYRSRRSVDISARNTPRSSVDLDYARDESRTPRQSYDAYGTPSATARRSVDMAPHSGPVISMVQPNTVQSSPMIEIDPNSFMSNRFATHAHVPANTSYQQLDGSMVSPYQVVTMPAGTQTGSMMASYPVQGQAMGLPPGTYMMAPPSYTTSSYGMPTQVLLDPHTGQVIHVQQQPQYILVPQPQVQAAPPRNSVDMAPPPRRSIDAQALPRRSIEIVAAPAPRGSFDAASNIIPHAVNPRKSVEYNLRTSVELRSSSNRIGVEQAPQVQTVTQSRPSRNSVEFARPVTSTMSEGYPPGMMVMMPQPVVVAPYAYGGQQPAPAQTMVQAGQGYSTVMRPPLPHTPSNAPIFVMPPPSSPYIPPPQTSMYQSSPQQQHQHNKAYPTPNTTLPHTTPHIISFGAPPHPTSSTAQYANFSVNSTQTANAKAKKRRSSFTEFQTKILNNYYLKRQTTRGKYASEEIRDIAVEIGLTEHQVKIFFQNKRARSKSQDTTSPHSSVELATQKSSSETSDTPSAN